MKIRMPSVENAIKYLRPQVEHWDFYIQNGEGSFSMWEDPSGSKPPTWEEISLQVRKDAAIWGYYEYARKREEKYGDIGDQLDMLYNDIKNNNIINGQWVTHVESVKDQIQKPTESSPNVDEWTIEDFNN